MKTFSSIKEVVGHGTFLESSVPNFEKFYSAPFKGRPVEFCYNSVQTMLDKNLKEKKTPSFVSKHYFCLRAFNGNHKYPTDALLMKFTNRDKKKSITKKFYGYLLGKDSPWKEAFPASALINDDAIMFYDTGKPQLKTVMNLLSAIRLQTCWALDPVWLRLVDAGYSPEAAILLCTNFSWNGQSITIGNYDSIHVEDPWKDNNLYRGGCSKTDMPFSTNYNPSGFAPLLKDKTPKIKSGSLMEGTPPQPNNCIWHNDAKEVNADDLNKGSVEYKKSRLRVGTKATPIYDYLQKKTNKLSSSYVQEMEEKLIKNEEVYV